MWTKADLLRLMKKQWEAYPATPKLEQVDVYHNGVTDEPQRAECRRHFRPELA